MHTEHEVSMAAEAAFERTWAVLHPDELHGAMVPFDMPEDVNLSPAVKDLVEATFTE